MSANGVIFKGQDVYTKKQQVKLHDTHGLESVPTSCSKTVSCVPHHVRRLPCSGLKWKFRFSCNNLCSAFSSGVFPVFLVCFVSCDRSVFLVCSCFNIPFPCVPHHWTCQILKVIVTISHNKDFLRDSDSFWTLAWAGIGMFEKDSCIIQQSQLTQNMHKKWAKSFTPGAFPEWVLFSAQSGF